MSDLLGVEPHQASRNGRNRKAEGGGVVPRQFRSEKFIETAIKLVADQQGGDDVLSAAIAPFGRGQDRGQIVAGVSAELGSIIGVEREVIVVIDRSDQGAVDECRSGKRGLSAADQ